MLGGFVLDDDTTVYDHIKSLSSAGEGAYLVGSGALDL